MCRDATTGTVRGDGQGPAGNEVDTKGMTSSSENIFTAALCNWKNRQTATPEIGRCVEKGRRKGGKSTAEEDGHPMGTVVSS